MLVIQVLSAPIFEVGAMSLRTLAANRGGDTTAGSPIVGTRDQPVTTITVERS